MNIEEELRERDGIDKLPFFICYYPDGRWDLMTISHSGHFDEKGEKRIKIISGGGSSDIASDTDYRKILTLLKEIRELYLKMR